MRLASVHRVPVAVQKRPFGLFGVQSVFVKFGKFWDKVGVFCVKIFKNEPESVLDVLRAEIGFQKKKELPLEISSGFGCNCCTCSSPSILTTR